MSTIRMEFDLDAARRLIDVLRADAAQAHVDAPDQPAAAHASSALAGQLVTAVIAGGDHPLRFANDCYHFGGCPVCGCAGMVVSAGRPHWGVCHDHQVRWYIGDNLFSSWRALSPAERRRCWQQVVSYKVIEDPIPVQLCNACGLAGGRHAVWCFHADEAAGATVDLEVWGEL